ncbi:MAG: serine--tRNA ligase, partial [Candidatus Aminicenantes bacterium]
MLDPKYVLENAEFIIEKTKARGLEVNLDGYKKLFQKKKKQLTKTENLRFERNKASQRVAQMKKEGKDASSIITEMKKVSDEIKNLEEKLKEIDEELKSILLNIPNVPHESVPEGQSSEENVEVRMFGKKPAFSFP